MTTSRPQADVVIVGAGFGGLATALTLAEGGARVVLCEALNYPGGCASTFTRGSHEYESGATLFSGFGPGQLFRRWIDRHDLDVAIDFMDPVVEVRAPGLSIPVPRRREALVDHFAGLPGAPARQVRRFFARQKRVADVFWSILDDPDLIPPLTARAVLRHLGRSARYATLLPLMGVPLARVLRRYGLQDFEPLRVFLDGLCQITVQCPASEAEAPIALATMDYYFRGTGHVRGGIGHLASGLADAVESLGGEVRLSNRVRGLERSGSDWIVDTRRGPIRAPFVVLNTLPHSARTLLGVVPGQHERLDALAAGVESGWGAAMLYLLVRTPPGAGLGAAHLDLMADPSRAPIAGNHVFCSIGTPDASTGLRSVTVSTHVEMSELRALDEDAQGAYIAEIQQRMRDTMATLAPRWWRARVSEMTASPRTFQRFTRRDFGYVGGIPRRAGLHNYRHLVEPPLADEVYLVGDSIFPGQSTLATALGGVKVAERILARIARTDQRLELLEAAER